MKKTSTGGDMDAAFDFLARLADNNNRPWFKDHKEEYDRIREHWIEQLQRMIDAMSQYDLSLAGNDARKATFRIYRDTRFSLDKTPYKTHIGASITPAGAHKHCGYYIELNPNDKDCGIYGGIWCPEQPVLNKLRRAIADNSEEWEELTGEPQLNRLYPDWFGSTLKTIPKGWDKNHPMAKYLRMKEYGKYHRLGRSFFADSDWPLRAAETARPLKPLIDFLNYSINEEV